VEAFDFMFEVLDQLAVLGANIAGYLHAAVRVVFPPHRARECDAGEETAEDEQAGHGFAFATAFAIVLAVFGT
jgi:hypothetical protein